MFDLRKYFVKHVCSVKVYFYVLVLFIAPWWYCNIKNRQAKRYPKQVWVRDSSAPMHL
jgi:hypothetical protein